MMVKVFNRSLQNNAFATELIEIDSIKWFWCLTQNT
jgi:hypothetical protein